MYIKKILTHLPLLFLLNVQARDVFIYRPWNFHSGSHDRTNNIYVSVCVDDALEMHDHKNSYRMDFDHIEEAELVYNQYSISTKEIKITFFDPKYADTSIRPYFTLSSEKNETMEKLLQKLRKKIQKKRFMCINFVILGDKSAFKIGERESLCKILIPKDLKEKRYLTFDQNKKSIQKEELIKYINGMLHRKLSSWEEINVELSIHLDSQYDAALPTHETLFNAHIRKPVDIVLKYNTPAIRKYWLKNPTVEFIGKTFLAASVVLLSFRAYSLFYNNEDSRKLEQKIFNSGTFSLRYWLSSS